MTPTLLTLLASAPLAPADASPGPPWMGGALAAAGVAVLTGVSLRIWMRRRAKSRERTAASPRDRLNELTRQSQRDALESLMVEVQELTRTCSAQLENRAAKLEKLITDADDRLAELRHELSRERPAQAAQTHEPRPTPAPRPRLSGCADPLSDRVHRLARTGLSPVEIARQLDEQVGKVELILNLHSRRSA